ncbi:MAG: hypothetical protein HC795_03475 [Coleofasciculaceae cyanobacterium RL_1_1]|nr:hypothetical protein [Coleofasciculaceae cyanobacterium RL_1_1]
MTPNSAPNSAPTVTPDPMTPDRAAALLARVATTDRPTPPEVVAAMQAIERSHPGKPVALEDLEGTWRLTFVTGTKKARKRAGKVIGAGRYLAAIPKITLAYCADSGSDLGASLGRAVNTVAIGGLKLTVTGPIEAIAGKRILAFDFTCWSVAIGSWVVYRGEIGGGAASDASFADRPLKERPFFNYVWVSDRAIAARGKGGGLAMWVRIEDND